MGYDESVRRDDDDRQPQDDPIDPNLATPISQLGLSIRTSNSLINAGIKTLGDLLATTNEELSVVRRIGSKRLSEINRLKQRLTNEAASDDKSIGPHSQILGTDFSSLGLEPLSARARNALIRGGIKTLGDLVSATDDELLAIRNFGSKALSEVHRAKHALVGTGLLDYIEGYPDPSIDEGRDLDWKQQVLTLASSQFGIAPSELPDDHSWAALLSRGYSWESVEAFDLALADEGLPELSSLPRHGVVSVEAVKFLLLIGCPLHQIPAARVATTSRQRRFLGQRRIQTVLQLFLSSIDTFEDSPDLKSNTEYYAEWLGTQATWEQEVDTRQPNPVALLQLGRADPRDLVALLLKGMTDRNRQITMDRFGLLEGGVQTLQQVAGRHGITRERVRQICKKASQNAKETVSGNDILMAAVAVCRETVDRVLVARTEYVARELASYMEKSRGEELVPVVTFLLEEVLTSDSLAITGKLATDVWASREVPVPVAQTIIILATNLLLENMAPMSFYDLHNDMLSAPDIPAEWIENEMLLRACLEGSDEFAGLEDDYWGLRRWDNRLHDDIVMALRELGHPAHYSEITTLVNARLPSDGQTTERNVHAQLGRYTGLFYRTGQGTFALREWDPEAPLQPPKYIDLIEQVLVEAGKPLSIDEVYELVDAIRPANRSSVAMYLGLDKRFVAFEAGTYGLAHWAKDEPVNLTPEESSEWLVRLKQAASEQLEGKRRGNS